MRHRPQGIGQSFHVAARSVIGAFTLCGLLCLASLSHAAIVTVDKDGGKDHTTIQAAVSAANSGDTIEIYTGATAYNESVTIAKALTIKAASGQSPLLTNLSTNQAVSVFKITSGGDNVTLENLEFIGTGRNTSTRVIEYEVTASGNPVSSPVLRDITITDWCSNASSTACRAITTEGRDDLGARVENLLIERLHVDGGRFDQVIRLVSAKDLIIRDSTFALPGASKTGATSCALYVIKQSSAQEPVLTTGVRIERVRIHVTDTTAATNAFYSMNDSDGCLYQLLEGDVNPDNATITRTWVRGTHEMALLEPESRTSNWVMTHNILDGGERCINTSGPGTGSPNGGFHTIRQNLCWDIGDVALRQSERMQQVSWLGNAVVLNASGADFFVLRDTTDTNGTWDSTFTADYNRYLCDACSGTDRFRLNNPNGTDTRYTFAQWKSVWSNDANSTASTATEQWFVNASGNDFNPATGSPLIGAYSDGSNIGPLQEIVPLSASQSGTLLVITFSAYAPFLPIRNPDVSKLHVKYGAAAQTENSCVAGPNDDQVTCTMAAAPADTDTVTYDMDYGFVQDSACIGCGHDGVGLNSKSRAQTNQPVTNQSAGPGWVVGTNITIPTAADRYGLIALCGEHNAPASTLDFSNVAIGGQACTQLVQQTAPSGATTQLQNRIELWGCPEAVLTAATSGLITYDMSDTPPDARPEIVAARIFAGVTGVTDSDVGVTDEGTSVSTPALTTSNPGTAVYAVCPGSDGMNTPGAGWAERVDVADDASPSHRLIVASRTTDGTAVTPSSTYASTDTDGTTRLPKAAVALNGGDVASPPAATRTLVAWRIAKWEVGLTDWSTLLNMPASVVPGGKLNLMLHMEVTDAAEPQVTEKKLACRDNGGDEYEPLNAGTVGDPNFVAYTPFHDALGLISNGALIACPSPLGDPGGVGDCVPGHAYDRTGGFVSNALGLGDHMPLAFSARISASATGTIQCSLTPLDVPATPLTITIAEGGLGFGGP